MKFGFEIHLKKTNIRTSIKILLGFQTILNKTTPLDNLYHSLRKVGRRIREGSHHIVGHSNVFRLELRSSDNFEIKVFSTLKLCLVNFFQNSGCVTKFVCFQKTIQIRHDLAKTAWKNVSNHDGLLVAFSFYRVQFLVKFQAQFPLIVFTFVFLFL